MALKPPLLTNTGFGFPKTLALGFNPPRAGPFYFAWCDPDETTFGSEHHRMDEYIFAITRTLAEGEKPLLELEIENPHVGLLNPDRKVHAWVAWHNGTTIVPLGFFRVVGTPVEVFEEVISVQMISEPANYKYQRQKLAETMKVLPYWDPVWIDIAKRDDPDKILEAYGKFWDVDPVTGVVTAVSFVEGPDGNVDIGEDEHFYDAMSLTISQPPAIAILGDFAVSWTQTARGVVDLGNHSVTSFSDSIRGEWPKPLTQLGGGWSVFTSSAYEVSGADASDSVTISYSWQNKSKHHSNGDTMSVSFSQTLPMGPVGAELIITEVSQSGVIDPFAVDSDGDPSPLNIPSSYNNTSAAVITYTIQTSLVLEYAAERPRTERLVFLIRADTQPVLSDPDVDEESETINMVGADVGMPILNVLNWTSVSGEAVQIGQIIFPDDPQIPGGRTAQIALNDGTAGTEPPEFSDVPGITTLDGTVTWASLGVSAPSESPQDWYKQAPINVGTVILPRRPFYVTWEQLTAPGLHNFPPTGTSVSEGIVVKKDGLFYTVSVGGNTTSTGGLGTVVLELIGSSLVSGTAYFICTQAGTTGQYLPNFNETARSTTTDGTVEWTCIDVGEIPVGGVPGDVKSPTFWTLERGKRSIEYLGLLMRAKLLWRARCVDVEFETDWLTGIDITTRKTVTLHDPRIPGGIAAGKVKQAVLSFSDSGAAVCRVTIGCLVGKDNAVSQSEGDPLYVDAGYVDAGYQTYENVVTLMPTGSDLAYTPPVYRVTDDGLVFPLTRSQVVVYDEVKSIGDQQAGVESALMSMREAANTHADFRGGGNAWDAAYAAQLKKKLLSANSVSRNIQQNPVWIEYKLKPPSAGPFNSIVNVKFSKLTMARGIDLQSEVTT